MIRSRALSAILLFCLAAAAAAEGLTPLTAGQWNDTAVRRVLSTFAYGGLATDAQIGEWVRLGPAAAIRQMLTFKPDNPQLSPNSDTTASYGQHLADWQTFLASDSADNPSCPSLRDRYRFSNTRADGNVVPYNIGMQEAWIASLNKRGINPFRRLSASGWSTITWRSMRPTPNRS